MLGTTARSALCLRCTNCLRQYCTADSIPHLIKFNLKINQGSDAHIRQWIIWWRSEWLNKRCHEWRSQNVGCDNWRHEGVWFHHPQLNLGRRQNLWYRAWVHQPLEKTTKTRKILWWRRKRVTCSRSKKRGPSRATRCRACSSTLFCRWPWKMKFPRWRKKQGMGICLRESDHGCVTNLRFAGDVLLFASTKEQLQKKLCDVKHSTEKVGLKIHPGGSKILSSWSSNARKQIEIDNIEVEILTKEETYQISWSNGYIPATGDDRDQESCQGCVGDVPRIQARADFEFAPSSTSASLTGCFSELDIFRYLTEVFLCDPLGLRRIISAHISQYFFFKKIVRV